MEHLREAYEHVDRIVERAHGSCLVRRYETDNCTAAEVRALVRSKKANTRRSGQMLPEKMQNHGRDVCGNPKTRR